MFCLHRDFQTCSMGVYNYVRRGKPTDYTKKEYIERCNFVISVKGILKSLRNDEDLDGNLDKNSGWVIDLKSPKIKKKIFILNTETDTSKLKHIFLQSCPGCICKLSAEDFWDIIRTDSCENNLPEYFVSDHCGYIENVWVFPNVTLDSCGNFLSSASIFTTVDFLSKDRLLPRVFPNPIPETCLSRSEMHKLGKLLTKYYGVRTAHAVHVLAYACIALQRNQLMEEYHQMPILNISGPPNIGKTFICAIAQQLLNSSQLILSRCTASAMLDFTNGFKNMLVVWDDPRDASQSQLCSIVHEAFHGSICSTLSKGNRSYNSNIIIGTQSKLLNLAVNDVNKPTFSRLTHVDMDIDEIFYADPIDEKKLQTFLNENKDRHAFQHLLEIQLNRKKIEKLREKLSETTNIMERSLQSCALHWYFSGEIASLLDIPISEINKYFKKRQIPFLEKYCNKNSIFEMFCAKLNELNRHTRIPSSFFKEYVNVNLNNKNHKCLALYPKEFFPFFSENMPNFAHITEESIQHEIKTNTNYGAINKNVSFKVNNESNKVKRAFVIPHEIIDKFEK